mmetsp:Transcript_12120/g.48772  ORF Transcript_12120/g.48772 Transcript_12120/m.48772 type:complete len:99 (-) Transcript_12120:37-333(-)|eukprot:CAMPEP_0114612420 /NCGR_PEP_ID=MMETSP0168-20121206/4612_1 /TAXON_ID=95228 ORGANISM="Vannella sp., Strain DIVA3 517/6/12" /NCGR_SAMPLE_ID=MMETSP0168 /ASSEMBLY_ACC=CAM_ASM_000044 /LENGTH=98 /DNA_ID=CAMNT_0001823403 /DNA_START=34 /DNA_END=330 /DNA_ORIENTATION=+
MSDISIEQQYLRDQELARQLAGGAPAPAAPPPEFEEMIDYTAISPQEYKKLPDSEKAGFLRVHFRILAGKMGVSEAEVDAIDSLRELRKFIDEKVASL